MGTEFSRLAIVNRGESAMRLLNAVPEFNVEHGKPTTVRVAAMDTFLQVGAFSESVPVYGPRVRKDGR